jgi:hypothetical protein
MTDNDLLFRQLIASSKTLVTVCGLAADNLSDEFKDMVTGPMQSVKAILEQCPDPDGIVWDGVFREEDCKDEPYTPDVGDPEVRKGLGVRLTHIPTELSVLTYGSMDREENYRRAVRALKKRVGAHPGSVV